MKQKPLLSYTVGKLEIAIMARGDNKNVILDEFHKLTLCEPTSH